MKKVLIIEDDLKLHGLWQKMIRRYELEDRLHVIFATTIGDAMLRLGSHPDFDLVALDGSLEADGDGLAFVPELREMYFGPILAISANDDMRRLMKERGCTHECEKKFVLQNIRTLLEITPRQNN